MNIFSMTAFSRYTLPISGGIVNYEIRTVNHRFLEIYCHLPEKFRQLDFAIREVIRQQLGRGKCELTISFEETQTNSNFVVLNESCLQTLHHHEEHIKKFFPHARSLSVADLLRYPGVIKENKEFASEIEQAILKGLNKSLEKIKEMRAKEGEALALIILEQLAVFEKGVQTIHKFLPQISETLQQKMRDHLNKLIINIDENRFEQELVYWLQKIDVTEEIDRLYTHIAGMKDILKTGGKVGRKLDFLLQEMQRETNTLTSKTPSAIVSKEAVELKVLIEQIREQIQNIE